MSILKIENLKKSYKDTQAVKNISFSVEKGDIYGVLGPNGAGKSTTINSIVGFIKPDSGSIVFEDKYSINEWKRNIGYIPQELAIYPDLTAEENVSFFCSLYGFSGKELKKRTERALVFTGLENYRKKKASEFSGGMKRRLNIAAAIAHGPKLVIMDEPTVGIDPRLRNHILESVKKLNQEGTSIIYTTHYMEEVEELCNKIIIIDHGSVITNGYKDEVKTVVAPVRFVKITVSGGDIREAEKRMKGLEGMKSVNVSENELTCICGKSDSIIQEILNVISELKLNVTDISCESPSLEEVFITLTEREEY